MQLKAYLSEYDGSGRARELARATSAARRERKRAIVLQPPRCNVYLSVQGEARACRLDDDKVIATRFAEREDPSRKTTAISGIERLKVEHHCRRGCSFVVVCLNWFVLSPTIVEMWVNYRGKFEEDSTVALRLIAWTLER